ncbi:respiratory nitrate reductase subunit gamma [Streptomyces salinarius]|uniref:respiratory nitrate reductase subunit gamma n=1 Tax=Streptomyces salinarius TaxID=2762598 RepID=UPI0036F38CF5
MRRPRRCRQDRREPGRGRRPAAAVLAPGGLPVWFRGLFVLSPRPEAIAGAPLLFRLHAPSACPPFAAWPFTRLVHVWSAPVGHLVRPCPVYRRRGTGLACPACQDAAPRGGTDHGTTIMTVAALA